MTTRSPMHFRELVAVALRFGRSREDAEDLAQDALLRLHQLKANTSVVNEAALLKRIVANLSVNQYRRDVLASDARASLEIVENYMSRFNTSLGPENVLSVREQLQQIITLLAAVSERTCIVFLARRAGYSHAEIAEWLGISAAAVRKHITRAVAVLWMSGIDQPE